MRKIIVLLCMLLTLPIGSMGYVPPKWEAGWHFDYYGDNDGNASLSALGVGIIGGAVTTGITYLLYHHQNHMNPSNTLTNYSYRT